MAIRAFIVLAVVAGLSAVVLFAVHSFIYVLPGMLAVLFAAAAGAARSMVAGKALRVTVGDILRIVVIVAAVALLYVDPGDGRQFLVVYLIAAALIVAAGLSWWSERRARQSS